MGSLNVIASAPGPRLPPTPRSMSKNPRDELYVGLVQFNAGLSWTRQRFRGRKKAGGAVMGGSRAGDAESWSIFPYSVGLLQAYVQRHAPDPGRYRFLAPLHRPMPVDEAVERLEGADVVGFSAYVWNVRLSLAVAKRLKRRRPETVVIFGGPQVPDRVESFLRENPWVDVACHGEGEPTFLGLLEAGLDRDWEAVAGVSFLSRDGRLVSRPRGPRLADLDSIPSPYLAGVFDPLIEASPRERWVLLWETNRGCPFSCTFCDWGSAVASKVFRFGLDRLRAELEWFATRRGEFIFCCDANFGILPRDLEIARMAADVKARHGHPRTLSVQNTKNATERAYRVQQILAQAGMNAGVTLSLQSLDPGTLAASRRDNISLGSFQELQRRYTRERVETYTDMILSLPGETYDSFVDGVSQVIENGQHGRIHFYNCSVLPNAELGDHGYQRRHGLVMVAQRIVPMHASIEEDAGREIHEYVDTVVATDAMPPREWARAKAFWWMTDLIHFDRLLQIPLVVLHLTFGVRYRDLIEAFTEATASRFPVVAGIRDGFLAKARDVQDGGAEYCPSPEWLGIFWPADQLALIELAARWRTEAFYEEAETILAECLRSHGIAEGSSLLHEAILLNQSLLRLPFELDDLELMLGHDVWELYRAGVEGRSPRPAPSPVRYLLDRTGTKWLSWEEWCEHVVFCQNQKATYLYPLRVAAEERAQPVPAEGARV